MLLLMFFVVSSLTPLVKPLHGRLWALWRQKQFRVPCTVCWLSSKKKGVIKESLINFLLSPLVSLTQKKMQHFIFYIFVRYWFCPNSNRVFLVQRDFPNIFNCHPNNMNSQTHVLYHSYYYFFSSFRFRILFFYDVYL